MIECIWCQWEGSKKELDEGTFCPCCGGMQFRRKENERVKRHEPELVKTRVRKKQAMGR